MSIDKESNIDSNKRYSVKGHPGVAFCFWGYEQKWVPYTYLAHYDDCETPEKAPEDCCNVECDSDEGEWEDAEDVLMVMVGDDYKWKVDPKDCTVIPEEAYCHGCGQMGCTGDGYDRSEA